MNDQRMRRRSLLGPVLGVSSVIMVAGCAAIAGLDDFSRRDDGPGGSGGSGGSGADGGSTTNGGSGGGGGEAGSGGSVACTSPTDCPDGLNGTRTCEANVCGFDCADGFDDCDADVGCELDVTSDIEHCGDCSTTCNTYCEEGACNDPIAVSPGYAHTCAILANGSVWCWGFNSKGQLGNNSTVDSWEPVEVLSGAVASQIDANGRYMPNVAAQNHVAQSCALVGQNMMCWGDNEFGQLGMNDTNPRLVPTNVPLNGMNVTQIAVGGSHTCALIANGDLYCWGRNSSGQLGTGNTTDLHMYDNLLGPITNGPWLHVSAGSAHTCAVRTGNQIYCWGSDFREALGNGASGNSLTPQLVVGPNENMNMTHVACGRHFTCGWGAAGAICWGDNGAGQLGDDSTINRNSATVLDLPNVDFIGPGHYHTGGIAAGQLYMWGENANNQLGDGTILDAHVPEPSSLTNATDVACSEHHSCAVTTDNGLFCWGANDYGALGDGTTQQRATPTPVAWPAQ